MISSDLKVTAFAPASVANVVVGFDFLGFSLADVGDEITVSLLDKRDSSGAYVVEVTSVTGLVTELPKDSRKNTASVGLHAMIQDLQLKTGFSISIKKGIAVGSGMGGSAASAVGAVVAANELLMRKFSKETLTPEQLLGFCLQGEKVASGSIHGDNVGPCLQGGLTLVIPTQPMRMISVPVPPDVFCVLVHPDLEVETRAARGILKREVSLASWIEQSAWTAGFIAGCFKGDLDLIRTSMKDVVIEAQRSHLIPGFAEMKKKAEQMGAIGFSISGSGPSVFAWVKGKTEANRLSLALSELFLESGISSQQWVSPLQSPGARIIT